jgi:hypothetical protein
MLSSALKQNQAAVSAGRYKMPHLQQYLTVRLSKNYPHHLYKIN